MPKTPAPSPFRDARDHIFMFQERFRALVANGQKRQTIRAERKRAVHIGDLIVCRRWTGKPYRSRQANLYYGRCHNIVPVLILSDRVLLATSVVPHANLDDFARADGFNDFVEMRDWFQSTHGLPFEGTLYQW